MSENLYWIWLSRRCAYDSGSLDRLLRVYTSPRAIYEASEVELRRALGDSAKTDLSRLCYKDLSDAQRIMDFCMMTDVGILAYDDPRYPARLRMLSDAPPVLYYKGNLPTFEGRLAVAVVGTRKMSDYGKRMAFEIAHDLTRAGATVVTGMALGIDGVASAAAVAAEAPSVAVLGSGIDIIYPREHQYLMHAITQNGVVMTEFAPGTPPDGRNFPRRNRIISGLSQGVLVIEGDSKSGALITARHAEKQGRDVYALPGNADEVNSEATTRLLKNGACPVSCADDIIRVYEPLYGNTLNMLRLLDATRVRMDKTLSSLRVSARLYYPKYKVYNGEEEKKAPATLVPDKKSRWSKREQVEKKTQTPVTPSPQKADGEEKMQLLDPATLAVYKKIKPGLAFTVDELCAEGFSAAEVLAAMTILEIHKCVMALPGGRYTRL
ncbi:MAG: DNA-processing protein DprA [Clostridia bacterium]|nr:DNA-processing protein DprA [Clostridia bacterium]